MVPLSMRLMLSRMLCVIALLSLPLEAGTSAYLQPVALWPASTGGLYVLDKDRGLLYIPTDTSTTFQSPSTVATFNRSWQTVDMAAIASGSDERVYVLLAQETSGMLLCYSHRRFERSWIAKTLLTGMTADPAGKRLFFSGGLTNDVYVLDLNDPAASPTKIFAPVRGSQILGPLALDSSGGVLFAGDERTGSIFAINVESKSVSQLIQIGGQPSALTFDPVHRTLYVADSVGRKVWAIKLGGKGPQSRPFSSSRDFRQPSALAIDVHGLVWLGDQGSRAIYQLSPDGSSTVYLSGN